MLSVIIPSYKDPLLGKTINSLLENAEGEIEVIPVLDGYEQDIEQDERVKPVCLESNVGMRGATNAGLAKAKGDFIMKADSHCLFGPGFDRIMIEDCAEDWLMIPRRYSLNVAEWRISKGQYIKDYHYLAFPRQSPQGFGLFPQAWTQRTYERIKNPEFVIDDTMVFQGSCYFANRAYFMKHVGFLDDEPYGPFSDEPLEVGLKYWLGGGAVKVNKRTYYAHLFKNKKIYQSKYATPRRYKFDRRTKTGHAWGAKHWVNDEEPDMIHPFSWLVEKFWPVPTWPEDRALWHI